MTGARKCGQEAGWANASALSPEGSEWEVLTFGSHPEIRHRYESKRPARKAGLSFAISGAVSL